MRSLLQPERGGLFVDCTLGLGGHTRMLLEHGATRVIGIDRDVDAIDVARGALEPWSDRLTVVHGDYRQLDGALDRLGVDRVSGVL
ncbi:MAG: 16S rRNA (cytosine(1402)-N(4))-methyltransferase, partial [Vicinamibacterales bacterium]